MKVLLLTNKPFLPTIDGGNAASFALVNQLIKEGAEVETITFFSKKHPFQKDLFVKSGIENIHGFFLDLEIQFTKIWRSFFNKKSYQISRFESKDLLLFLSSNYKKNNFDILLFDSLFSAQMIERIKELSLTNNYVMRAHNVEHEIWEQKKVISKNPFKKWVYNKFASQLKRREIEISKQMDLILTISEENRSSLEKLVQIKIINFPYHAQNSKRTWIFKPNSAFHFGAMNWHSNLESLDMLATEIFPKLIQKIPQLQLYVAGSFMEKLPLKKEYDQHNIHLIGFVKDKNTFLTNHGILLAPIISGSGVRVKIVEALALGVPVITTKIGAEGISKSNENGLVICDSIADFIKQSIRILSSEQEQKLLSKNALNYCESNKETSPLLSILTKKNKNG